MAIYTNKVNSGVVTGIFIGIVCLTGILHLLVEAEADVDKSIENLYSQQSVIDIER